MLGKIRAQERQNVVVLVVQADEITICVLGHYTELREFGAVSNGQLTFGFLADNVSNIIHAVLVLEGLGKRDIKKLVQLFLGEDSAEINTALCQWHKKSVLNSRGHVHHVRFKSGKHGSANQHRRDRA